MTWMSNCVVILLSNSIGIILAWLLWRLVLIPLKALRLYTICYHLFILLAVFWLVPFHYIFCSFYYFRRETVWSGLPWHSDAFGKFLHILGIIWIAGCVLYGMRVLLGIYKIAHLPFSRDGGTVSRATGIARNMDRRSWLLDANGNEQLYPGLDFTEPVQICRTRVPVPMAPLGIKSRIFLPFCTYTNDELSMVIAHELSHIRRGDLKIRGLLLVIRVLFWFHPLAWRMFLDFEDWSEVACDVDVCSGKNACHSPKQYFSLLIRNAGQNSPAGRRRFYENSCFMSGLSLSGRRLKTRIKRVQSCKKSGLLPLLSISLCAVFLLAGTALCIGGGTLLEQRFSALVNRTYMTRQDDITSETLRQNVFTIKNTDFNALGNLRILQEFSDTRLLSEHTDTFYDYWLYSSPDTDGTPPTYYFGGTADAGISGAIKNFHFAKGTEVTIYTTQEPDGRTLTLGWLAPDGTAVGFSREDVRYGTYTVPATGTYTLYVSNQGTAPATVSARVLY